MAQTLHVFSALFSHWRRHKLQLVTLIIGLASATALWTAVQALNDHARASYDRSAATVAAFDKTAFVSKDRQAFAEQAFADFRRAGVLVTPIVEGRLGPPIGGLTITGIDPLTFGAGNSSSIEVPQGQNMVAFFQPPGALLADAATARQLARLLAAVPENRRPAVTVQNSLGGGRVIGDIGIVQRLLGLEGKVSKLMVVHADISTPTPLPPAWRDSLTLLEPPVSVDLAGLTDSFHLNLTAFALLCFLVGLFIVYSAIGLAIEDRISALRTLRICGVSLRALLATLAGEMCALAFVAGVVGVAAGYFIAAQLLPDVAASLRGLYGARVGGTLSLDASWWIGGVAVSVLGALGASLGAFIKVAGMSLFDTRGTTAWRQQQSRALRRLTVLSMAFFIGAAGFYLTGGSLFAAFMVMAGLLLGGAFLLPVVLSVILSIGRLTGSGPLSQWFWADSRQQLSGLSLALMALLLALGANIGVSGMVEGFRLTFNDFLDERLSADLYVQTNTNAQAQDLIAWAQARSDVEAVLPIWGANGAINGTPVTVTGFEDHPSYRETWRLLSSTQSPWQDTQQNGGILINEQLHYRQRLEIGDTLSLETETGPLQLMVSGIYSDYGNPRGDVRLPNTVLKDMWPSGERRRVSLIAGDATDLKESIADELRVPLDQMIEQTGLKDFSKRIFERTFVISGALSTLTLGVAGVAMVTSLLTLAGARLNGVAPLWAMGVRRSVITRIEGLKILMLAALTSISAIPLGIAISWCLVAVINVAAFGWRLPLYVFPSQWLALGLLGVVTAFVASLYPLFKLRRTPPAELAKVFSHDH